MNINLGKYKDIIDRLLVLNLFIIILGSVFFIASIILSLYGNIYFMSIFQKLWYPVFIPSLSIFFSSIFIEIIYKIVATKNNN